MFCVLSGSFRKCPSSRSAFGYSISLCSLSADIFLGCSRGCFASFFFIDVEIAFDFHSARCPSMQEPIILLLSSRCGPRPDTWATCEGKQCPRRRCSALLGAKHDGTLFVMIWVISRSTSREEIGTRPTRSLSGKQAAPGLVVGAYALFWGVEFSAKSRASCCRQIPFWIKIGPCGGPTRIFSSPRNCLGLTCGFGAAYLGGRGWVPCDQTSLKTK
jgi:hypothetical protein